MSEKLLRVWQVLDPKDWIKLFTGEFHNPALYEKLGGCFVYFCFACGGGHLYFCISEVELDLRIPRETMEAMNGLEVAFWDEMSMCDWYLEMRALLSSGYKEE